MHAGFLWIGIGSFSVYPSEGLSTSSGLWIGFSIPEQGLEYSARLVDLPELQITLLVSLRVLFHLLSSLRGGHWP